MNLLRAFYLWKIKIMFYFGLGYNEVNGFIALAKDLAIFLGFAVLILKVKLGIIGSIIIGIGVFIFFTIVGVVLKKTGMSDYGMKINNSVNPELKLIRKIAEKLNIKE